MFHDSHCLTAVPAGNCAPLAAKSEYLTECVALESPSRDSLQEFIAQSFHRSYGATLSHFSDTLLGCKDENGCWIAGLGYSLAAEGPLFLEQYLDAPIERMICAHVGQAIERGQIVEVGNLAAGHPGAARALIIGMTRLLHAKGLRWVAFTATASLVNSFARLRLQPSVLADADPQRLPDGGGAWGSYYQSQPKVMYGNIGYGYARLA